MSPRNPESQPLIPWPCALHDSKLRLQILLLLSLSARNSFQSLKSPTKHQKPPNKINTSSRLVMCQWVFYGKDSQMCCYFFRLSKSSQRDVPFHPTRPFPVATLTSTQENSVNDDANLRSGNFLTQMKSLLRASPKFDQIFCFWSGSSGQWAHPVTTEPTEQCQLHKSPQKKRVSKNWGIIYHHIFDLEARKTFTPSDRCNFHQWANICYIYLWQVFNGDLPFGPVATCIIFCSSSKTRNSWSSGFLGPPRLSIDESEAIQKSLGTSRFWCERCCLGGVVVFCCCFFWFGEAF